MNLLEKAYKTNIKGEVVEEIVVNEIFETHEELVERANQFEGYLILANYNSEVHGGSATTKNGELVKIENLTEKNEFDFNKEIASKELAKLHNVKVESVTVEGDRLVLNNNIMALVHCIGTKEEPNRMYMYYRTRKISKNGIVRYTTYKMHAFLA